MLREPDVKVIIPEESFNDAFKPYLDCVSRTQIYFGGSGSGKSWFLAQRAIKDVMEGGRNYLILRQVARTIKHSVFAQLCQIISDWNVNELININKSEYWAGFNEESRNHHGNYKACKKKKISSLQSISSYILQLGYCFLPAFC
jgi:hypothetical protein